MDRTTDEAGRDGEDRHRAGAAPVPGQPDQGGGAAGHLAGHAVPQNTRSEPGGGGIMSERRETVMWLLVAVAALVVFGVAARREFESARRRGATNVSSRPSEGDA